MKTKLILNKIPIKYLEWLASSRIKFFDSMINGKPTKYFSAHLPVMATWRDGEPFPVNMTVKGIGLIPKQEKLYDWIDIFEGITAEARTESWDKSLAKRIAVMKRLYCNMENFNPSLLGGLEIFEGRAFENLRGNPHASLLYVGMVHTSEVMQYISFQVNGTVEILEKNNPYYRFLIASRRLFEFEKFHLYQPDYPFGYLIRVAEVKDKSPWSRKPHGHKG